MSPDRLASLPGSDRAAALAQHAAMRATVDEVGRVAAAEGIDAGFHKGGTVVVARSEVQLARARAEVDHARAWGRGPDDLRLLDAAEARAMLAAEGAVGGTFTPDCAVVHPARLVRGLARAVERRGGVIHEHSRALRLSPGLVEAERGRVRARYVVRATEGYTPGLAGQRRAVVPVYSLVVATEPLSDGAVGADRARGPADASASTATSSSTASGPRTVGWSSAVAARRTTSARRWRPASTATSGSGPRCGRRWWSSSRRCAGSGFSHAWGGPLGVARDWCASVGLDPSTGMGWAGGYVGDGVSTTNLAGRTLRDLVLGERTDLTRLPWVQHRSPRWEPEPLRWAGINAGLRAMTMADHEERLTGRPSVVARAMAPFLGH